MAPIQYPTGTHYLLYPKDADGVKLLIEEGGAWSSPGVETLIREGVRDAKRISGHHRRCRNSNRDRDQPCCGVAFIDVETNYHSIAKFIEIDWAAGIVNGISPNHGSPSGGTAVTVSGGGFTSSATAYFGPVPAIRVILINSSTLIAVAPPGSGQVDVRVGIGGSLSPPAPSDLHPTVEGQIKVHAQASLVSPQPLSSDRKCLSRPPSTPPQPKRKHQRDGRRYCYEHQLRG